MKESPYGKYCYDCGAPIVSSTRGGPNALHTCENGHKNHYSKSKSEPNPQHPRYELVPASELRVGDIVKSASVYDHTETYFTDDLMVFDNGLFDNEGSSYEPADGYVFRRIFQSKSEEKRVKRELEFEEVE